MFYSHSHLVKYVSQSHSPSHQIIFSQAAAIDAVASERSLVIVDELGRGTDPASGAAVAFAFAERFALRGCLCLFATHFRSLLADVPRLYPQASAFVQCVDRDRALFKTTALDVSPSFSSSPSSPDVSSKVSVGDDKHFGISHARRCGWPEEVLSTAEAIVGELDEGREEGKGEDDSPSSSSFSSHALRRLQYDSLQNMLNLAPVMREFISLQSRNESKGEGTQIEGTDKENENNARAASLEREIRSRLQTLRNKILPTPALRRVLADSVRKAAEMAETFEKEDEEDQMPVVGKRTEIKTVSGVDDMSIA